VPANNPLYGGKMTVSRQREVKNVTSDAMVKLHKVPLVQVNFIQPSQRILFLISFIDVYLLLIGILPETVLIGRYSYSISGDPKISETRVEAVLLIGIVLMPIRIQISSLMPIWNRKRH
jgi:uncharacterized protein (UPF0548 family)